ncbi:glutaredoxin-like protein [Eastern grey kangaroopox virus]|uniref:Glutaredoxin-2 n=1 Tax=Eastern grey kangaroopox virus TaxID=2042482 RepID=A0A2C9DT28_9POXV|nr:glutaredoxin-like protein [Eastern grey kangaroopox virus]ATI21161.1 glutaredoxin-like protein [Eastern grey kangaroopox virus]ATX75069.1 glutaredoxin-like protein [Eastern grey kangaroopox virus]
MKDVIILFGKSLCPLCRTANDILTSQKMINKHDIIRVNILSFFSDSRVVEVLGMNGAYEMIAAVTEYFGRDYVLVLKYNPETQNMGVIPFRKYIVIGQMSPESVDYEQLARDIASAPYNAVLAER